MKKIWVALLCAVMIMAAGAAVATDATDTAETDGEAEWTVLFYLCGSDLESRYGYASENLREIASCRYPRIQMTEIMGDAARSWEIEDLSNTGRINVLIETGGSKQWHADDLNMEIRTDALQRWRYEGYATDDIPDGYYLEETLPLQNMAEPETLQDFIRWSAEHYPAKKYALVLWDHGGGSKTGIFIDELFPGDMMSLRELGSALRDSGVQLEAVLFDACMMGNLETAYAVSDSARWMIASEEVVAGKGTAIGSWLQQLYIDPEFDGEWLGRWVCDMTQIKYAAEDNEQAQQLLTWSVIDLSRVPVLTTMFDLTMRRIGQIYVQYPRMMSTYAKYLTTVEHYGSEEDNMWDLAGVFYMPEMSTLMDDEVHKKLLYALKETVVYCVRGPGRSAARGLSFCYAVDFDKAELDEYARNCPCPHYLAFLDAISPWTAPDWVYETAERLPEAEALEEYRVVAKKTILEDGTPALSFDADCYLGASSVRYNIFGRYKDTNEIISLGILPAMYDASNGENGTFSAMKLWKWPSLQGEYVTSFVIGQVSPGAREYLGSIPIRIGADKWFLRYGYFYDDDRYVVYGLWDGYESSNGLFNRNVKSLAQLAGQEYCLLYPVFISDYEVPTEFYTGQPQNIYRSLSMESQTIPPSTYYIQYVVYDMFMRPMPMELIEINWDGEKLTLADGVSWEGEETLQVDPDYWE